MAEERSEESHFIDIRDSLDMGDDRLNLLETMDRESHADIDDGVCRLCIYASDREIKLVGDAVDEVDDHVVTVNTCNFDFHGIQHLRILSEVDRDYIVALFGRQFYDLLAVAFMNHHASVLLETDYLLAGHRMTYRATVIMRFGEFGEV